MPRAEIHIGYTFRLLSINLLWYCTLPRYYISLNAVTTLHTEKRINCYVTVYLYNTKRLI